MSMSIRVPDSLAATLAPDVLKQLEDLLAPPPHLRARHRLQIEIEAAGEGTFTLAVDGPVPVSAKKGFAREPFLSIQIAKGSWSLLQRELQLLVDGLPGAPALKRHVDTIRNPKPGELDALVDAAMKIKDACVKFDVKGSPGAPGGTFAVARGPVDEATRVLKIGLDAAEIFAVLEGRAPPSSIKASIGGDRGVLTTVAAAMAPMLDRLKKA